MIIFQVKDSLHSKSTSDFYVVSPGALNSRRRTVPTLEFNKVFSFPLTTPSCIARLPSFHSPVKRHDSLFWCAKITASLKYGLAMTCYIGYLTCRCRRYSLSFTCQLSFGKSWAASCPRRAPKAALQTRFRIHIHNTHRHSPTTSRLSRDESTLNSAELQTFALVT